MSLRVLIDLGKIEAWMNERGGKPARVKGKPVELAVLFPDAGGNVEPISWEDFVQTFKESLSVMLVDESPDKNYCKIYRHK